MVATGLGRFAAGAAVLASLLAACGSNHINLGSPPTTKPASATTSTIDPTADGGQEAAILAAYRGSLAAFNAVGTKAPVDPGDSRLASYMDGHELTAVTTAFAKLAAARQVNVGNLSSLRANVTEYNGTQAVVASCEEDDVAVVNAVTHQLAPGGSASHTTELINDLMTLDGGHWKVTQNSDVSAGCS